MEWSRSGPCTEVSNTSPAYKITRFMQAETKLFRASFKGEFIGGVHLRARAAKTLCENHHQINQEAKELTDGQTEGA